METVPQRTFYRYFGFWKNFKLLRSVKRSDLECIFHWRNDVTVRQWMFNQHEIQIEEHISWFNGLKDNPRIKWYIFLDECNNPQGVVYFTDIKWDDLTTFWGFYARPGASQGTGYKMLNDAIKVAFVEMGMLQIYADVLVENRRSIYLHEKLGFTEDGRFRAFLESSRFEVEILRFRLLASDRYQAVSIS